MNSFRGNKAFWTRLCTFLESVVNRIQSKITTDYMLDKTLNGRYKDLTPEKSIANGEEYFKQLRWALSNPRISNLALTGPYGAGKSSIIESFFAKEKSFKPLFISAATFNEHEKDADELAKGILQQLFYKVDYRKIPQSRFRKLHSIKTGWICLQLILLSAIGLIAFGIIDNATFNQKVEACSGWGLKLGMSSGLCWVIAGFVYVLLLVMVSHAIKWIVTQFGYFEISIADKAKFSTDKSNHETTFNKYLDEIVYFFEATDYNIVVLEDIDRFDNTEIFVRLRELNRLINNYDSIDRRIRFIYALRDDFFKTSTERTKFFDFIISVIPYINSTNSDNLLRRRLKEIAEAGTRIDIADDYVTQVAPYISDMRVLTSIFNDFVLYKNTLIVSERIRIMFLRMEQ